MNDESLQRRSQFVRHRQLGCVIGVELNDIGASILCDHPPLQRRRYGSIACADHVIPVDAVESSWRNRYRCREWRNRLRALPCDSPRRDVFRA